MKLPEQEIQQVQFLKMYTCLSHSDELNDLNILSKISIFTILLLEFPRKKCFFGYNVQLSFFSPSILP